MEVSYVCSTLLGTFFCSNCPQICHAKDASVAIYCWFGQNMVCCTCTPPLLFLLLTTLPLPPLASITADAVGMWCVGSVVTAPPWVAWGMWILCWSALSVPLSAKLRKTSCTTSSKALWMVGMLRPFVLAAYQCIACKFTFWSWSCAVSPVGGNIPLSLLQQCVQIFSLRILSVPVYTRQVCPYSPKEMCTFHWNEGHTYAVSNVLKCYLETMVPQCTFTFNIATYVWLSKKISLGTQVLLHQVLGTLFTLEKCSTTTESYSITSDSPVTS